MSGHSKWAQIKRQKGAADVKRGLTFTKLSNAITIAVRQGGGIGDPDQNFRLRLTVEKARSENMPKENIERAINRALDKQAGDFTEAVYEGFGPDGSAIVVEAATDNKMRTSSEIKNVFEKNGGTFGQPGSVSYMFTTKGQILISDLAGKTMDEIFLTAADAGAQDVNEADGEVVVFTQPEDLKLIREALISLGVSISDASIAKKPTMPLEVSEEAYERINAFVGKLEDLDDVQKVYTNVVLKQ